MSTAEIAQTIIAQNRDIAPCFAAVRALDMRPLELQALALAVMTQLHDKLMADLARAYQQVLEG